MIMASGVALNPDLTPFSPGCLVSTREARKDPDRIHDSLIIRSYSDIDLERVSASVSLCGRVNRRLVVLPH